MPPREHAACYSSGYGRSADKQRTIGAAERPIDAATPRPLCTKTPPLRSTSRLLRAAAGGDACFLRRMLASCVALCSDNAR